MNPFLQSTTTSHQQTEATDLEQYSTSITVGAFVIFVLCTSVLYRLDLLPESPSAEATVESTQPAPVVVVEATKPTLAPEIAQGLWKRDANGLLVPAGVGAGETEALEQPGHTTTADGQAIGGPDATVRGAAGGAPASQDLGLPERVIIDSVGINVSVENPQSTAIAALDQALLSGTVRYPGSADMDDLSTMLIFGHSTSLPVVRNQNFKAFNTLKEVETGAIIRVQSATHENVYRVRSVRLTTAEEAMVRFDTGQKGLTLSTCNTFGEKSERYVVEADFVGSYAR